MDGCAALRDLSIVACGIAWWGNDIIPPVAAFSRLTHLSVAGNDIYLRDLQHMWPAMPQLRVCDISHTECAQRIEPQAMVALLQRVPSLREVYFEVDCGDHDAELVDAVLQVRRSQKDLSLRRALHCTVQHLHCSVCPTFTTCRHQRGLLFFVCRCSGRCRELCGTPGAARVPTSVEAFVTRVLPSVVLQLLKHGVHGHFCKSTVENFLGPRCGAPVVNIPAI